VVGLIEKLTDLWTEPADARCVTTNGVLTTTGKLVMGAGVALQAKIMYSGIDSTLGLLVSRIGNVPYYLERWSMISFPTKNHWRDDSSLELIEKSAIRVLVLVNLYDLKKIVLPRPGCGYGNLKWEQVKPVIERIFDERFIVCHK
jgi:hypothetical protein